MIPELDIFAPAAGPLVIIYIYIKVVFFPPAGPISTLEKLA